VKQKIIGVLLRYCPPLSRDDLPKIADEILAVTTPKPIPVVLPKSKSSKSSK